jgi:hypothetical protein
MATPEQKAFCVLQFVKHESIVSVQRAFRRQLNSDPPSPNSIRRWYQQFQATGCLCAGKSVGRPHADQSEAGIGLSPRCVPVTMGAHIEHLWACSINLNNYSFITTSIYNSVHHTCEYKSTCKPLRSC